MLKGRSNCGAFNSRIIKPKEKEDRYLAIACKVGPEDVLDDGGVDGVEEAVAGSEEPEGLVPGGDAGVVVVDCAEVEKLMQDGASRGRKPSLCSSEEGGQAYEEDDDGCSCCN